MSRIASIINDLIRPKDDRIHVLGVTENELDQIILEGIARRARWDLRLASSCADALPGPRAASPDVILCNRDSLGVLADRCPGIPVIVLASSTDDRFWLDVMENGGYDVITRPFNEHRLVGAVRAAVQSATK